MSTNRNKTKKTIDSLSILADRKVAANEVLALVVGMGNYNYLHKLKFPAYDEDSMASVLASFNIEVIECKNGDKIQLRKAFHDWSVRLKGYKVGLFYYSGHGAEVYGKDYLFPISTPYSMSIDLNEEALPLDSVIIAMYSAKTKMNLIFLDACRDNPFPTKSIFPTGLQAVSNIPIGTFIGFSASPGSVSLDEGVNNSIYTEAILKSIRHSDLTIDQIFNNVNAYVRRYTNDGQVPFKNSSLDADFYFNLSKNKDIKPILNMEDKSGYSDSIKSLFPPISFGASVGDVISDEYGVQFRNQVSFSDLIAAPECKGHNIRYYMRKLSESNSFINFRQFLQRNKLDTMLNMTKSYILYQFEYGRLFRMDLRLYFNKTDFHSQLLKSLAINDDKYAAKFWDYTPEYYALLFLDPNERATSIIYGDHKSYLVCSNDWFSRSDTINMSKLKSN